MNEVGDSDVTIDNASYEKLMTLIRGKKPLREVWKAYVDYVLARNNGNKLRTARDLEVDRRSLQRWAKGDKACSSGGV